jgi:hypothetical protein
MGGFSNKLKKIISDSSLQKKITPHNSDGLIKCLRQRQESLVRGPEDHLTKLAGKVWAERSFFFYQIIKTKCIVPFIKFRRPPSCRLPGLLWRCRPTRRRLVFCSHRDYFVVTRSFTAVYRDLVPIYNFTVTRGFVPSTGTGKKRGTATQTAPNQTAGPLVFISRLIETTL